MSPLEAAIGGVCRDLGAMPAEWRGFVDLTLVGLALLLASLPPDLTVAELADHLDALGGQP